MKKRFLFGLSIIIFSLCGFTGCGKKAADPELDEYKKSMTEFYDSLTYFDKAINAIDPESEGAKSELLGYMDDMNEAYGEMAKAKIPEVFSGICDIAVEAADYMQKADEFYHQAYDNEFDENSEMLASQYYQRANSRAIVMLQVLHGEVPEGEGVSVETRSTYEFSTIDSDSDEGE